MNKKRYILFLLLSIFIFCYTYFFHHLYDDEIWNYGFGYNIYSGLFPYRDFNMIITPFYPYIESIFIFIFGHHLWSIHILNSIMISIIVFVMYKRIKYKIVLIIPIILLYSCPNYNLCCLFLLFLLFYIIDNNKSIYLIPLICSLIFLTKHTIGICLFIPMIYYSKDKVKDISIFFLPILIFIIYLLCGNALYNFINYCFLGMFDFTSKNKSFYLFPLELVLLFYLLYKNYKCKLKDKKLFYILMFQIITLPIVDEYHFMMGVIPVYYYVLENYNIEKYKFKYYFIIVYFAFFFYWFNFDYFRYFTYFPDGNSYLYGRKVPKNLESNMLEFSKYFNEKYKKYDYVYLLTSSSYFLKLNNNIKINKYDLINNGNMGYNGSITYRNEIKNNCEYKKCLFLIARYDLEENYSTQTDLKIIKFINYNYKKIDKVSIFYVYTNI